MFHATKDTSSGTLLVNASNGSAFAPREDLDTLGDTATIAQSGWYTLQHVFHEDAGKLAVTLNLVDPAAGGVHKTLSSG